MRLREQIGVRPPSPRPLRPLRPLRAAAVEDEDPVGQLVDFGAVVADVDHRHTELVAHPQQIGQDPPAPFDIDRGQRFVEQQQVGRGHQRAGERDALPFAAGQVRHAPLEQVPDLEHPTTSERELLSGTPAIEHVAADVHVREERRILRHIADVTRAEGDRSARLIEHDATANVIDPPARRPQSAIASRVVVLPDPDGRRGR